MKLCAHDGGIHNRIIGGANAKAKFPDASSVPPLAFKTSMSDLPLMVPPDALSYRVATKVVIPPEPRRFPELSLNTPVRIEQTGVDRAVLGD